MCVCVVVCVCVCVCTCVGVCVHICVSVYMRVSMTMSECGGGDAGWVIRNEPRALAMCFWMDLGGWVLMGGFRSMGGCGMGVWFYDCD